MAIPLTQRLKANWSFNRSYKKKTSTPIHKLTAGDFVWTFDKNKVIKVMILENYEKENHATEDHSLKKFLVGDSTQLIPISHISLEEEDWTNESLSDFNSYYSLEAEAQLIK